MPELSIIVPVYKVEPYLRRCLDSILAQTFRDFELILIDDGSPDNCGAICDEYAAKDSRIIVIHQKNQGVSAARNAGLDIARGTYLGFVDSDDWIEPEMYETMLATAREKNVDVVVCGIRHCDTDGKTVFEELLTEEYFAAADLRNTIYDMPNRLGGCIWNKVYNRDKIKKVRYRNAVGMAEDRLYLFDVFKCCTSAYKVKNCLYVVTERDDSATHVKKVSVPLELITSSYMLHCLTKNDSAELVKKSADKFLDDCVRYLPQIKKIGRENKQPYHVSLCYGQFLMLTVIGKASCRKLLPNEKIHGYLYAFLQSFMRRGI